MAKPASRKRPAREPNPAAFFTQAEADKARALTQGPESARTPSAVLDAFVEGGEPLTVAGYTVPVIGLGRYMILERIKSPTVDGQPGGFSRLTNPQLAELIFVCLQPEARSRSLLAQGGNAFADAVAEFSDGLGLGSLKPLGNAIALRLSQAMSTVISPASSGESAGGADLKKGGALGFPERGNGLGWGLTLLDTLLHEYGGGCSPEAIAAALRTPLTQAFALYAAIAARYGNEPKGPTYADRDLAAALSSPTP